MHGEELFFIGIGIKYAHDPIAHCKGMHNGFCKT